MCLSNVTPVGYMPQARKAATVLSGMNNVLLAAHVNLDGDALGALAACGNMFQALGRNFALYSSTGVPSYLNFLDLPGPVYRDLAAIPFTPEYAVFLDCSTPLRLGKELEGKYSLYPSVNIDHHLTEKGLGSLYNFISPEAAATSQLMAYVISEMNIPLRGNIANSIALGLMTDTGGFCHGNTTADVFSLCAILAGNGCDMTWLREKLQNSWTLGKLHLWGMAFKKVRVYLDGQIAICAVSDAELEECHCTREDLEGLVEWLRKIRGVKIGCLVREEGHKCKFSLRSTNEIDVQEIAGIFGGGGHRNAAGGTIDADLEHAADDLLQGMKLALQKRPG